MTKIRNAYAPGTPGLPVLPPPILAQRAPASTDTNYSEGQEWFYTTASPQQYWKFFGAAGWVQVITSSGGETLNSLTVVGPTTLTGTTNINTSGSAVTTIGTGGTGAVNIGNTTGNTAVTGSLTASTGLIATTGGVTATAGGVTATAGGVTATVGNITATNGNVVLGTAGNKLSITTGSNASIGTSVAMTAGTVTVSTTAVTASSKIFLTTDTPGGTQGVLSVGTIVAGTSFVINSSNNADTSTVNWWIVN